MAARARPFLLRLIFMTTTLSSAPLRANNVSRFYAIAWRWHFYAGLYVVPFLVMLSLTGLAMVFFTGFQTRLGMTVYVTPQSQVQPVTVQAKAALDSVPGAALNEYIAPPTREVASWFAVTHSGATEMVAVDPYTSAVLNTVNKDHTVFAWANKIHGTLLIGDVGDRLVEIAAGLGIVMLITGLYLFWPRKSERWAEVLVPDWSASGRKWWKSLHASVGFWVSVVLFLFLLSGMAWTGVWGGKLVQPWGSFPASKWDAVPTSDATHASLNTAGQKEVPWGLEQTPLPVSGSKLGAMGVAAGESVDLDGVSALAHRLGFSGQYHINVPQGATGVYTLSKDTMSGDLDNPMQDRVVHIDRYTGRVLAEAAFADYSLMAKAMAVGIALHQGDLGVLNALVNVVFCLAILLLCVSGAVMWWKRRPQGSGRLGAPSVPPQAALWKGGAIVMLITGLAFPLAGGVLVVAVLLDALVLSRFARLRAVFN
jgi:uncharacterized iron-regulated membrane protein